MPCLYELNDKCINQIFKILDVLFFSSKCMDYRLCSVYIFFKTNSNLKQFKIESKFEP